MIGVGKNHSQRFEETHPNLAEKFSLILNVAILLWWVRKKHVHGINYINHPSRFSFVKEERGICYPDNSAVTMTPTVSFSVFAIALLIVGTSANEERMISDSLFLPQHAYLQIFESLSFILLLWKKFYVSQKK